MADELKSNLEPIKDADLDLKNKFAREEEEKAGQPAGENKKEAAAFVLEKLPEKAKEGAVEKEKAYAKILSIVKSSASPTDGTTIASDAQITNQAQGAEAKIETLIKLASTKGVIHAVKVAKHLEDNFALDEFHGRLLADELHDALVKKGLIKEL